MTTPPTSSWWLPLDERFIGRDMLWWASRWGCRPTKPVSFNRKEHRRWPIVVGAHEHHLADKRPPNGNCCLPAPGRGLALDDGTLIFPAQFKQDIGVKAIDGGQYTCHSTIVYSRDGGNQWHIANGAKPNTTESQVVQLADGSLMLNMRDDLNRINKGEGNGRAVATTHDMGKSWELHPSSNRALPEPNCMAGLIGAWAVSLLKFFSFRQQ